MKPHAARVSWKPARIEEPASSPRPRCTPFACAWPWLLLLAIAPPTRAQWTHFAATPARISITDTAAPALTPTWSATQDVNADPISFIGPAGVVSDHAHVYALGTSAGITHVYAFDHSGAPVWQHPIDPPVFDSWSTPAAADGLVIVASGQSLAAFDTATGGESWSVDLGAPIVNASPAVAHERVYITTYAPFGDASLVCVSIAGEQQWQVPIGPASGATPAVADDTVYVSNVDGQILAFDAIADEPPAPRWTFDEIDQGFFGGPVVTPDAIYAATYDVGPGQLNSILVKLDLDGSLIWSAPCGRTNSTPIPAEDRVYLSTGLAGFGALPAVQAFTDHGDHATLDWDSALDSWVDANDNGIIDEGEYLSIGGWTHQPILTPQGLLVGTIANGFFDPYTDLRLIDVARTPDDPSFVIDHTTAAGSTPALTAEGIFSVGTGGLAAFLPCAADCNNDTQLDILDFVCFQQRFVAGDESADCNTDGELNVLDFVCYQQRFQQGCDP